MKFKERHDLPSPLVKALKHDAYHEGLTEHFEDLPEEVKHRFSHVISVTSLSRAPRQRVLFARHSHEMEFDPVSKFWSLLGRLGHSILEDYGREDGVTEERLGFVFPLQTSWAGAASTKLDIYVHGQLDYGQLQKELIQDWKFTSAGALKYPKDDHHAQLNMLAHICRKNGRKVSRLQNVYLIRDWNDKYVREGADYPAEPVVVVDVPVWTEDQCHAYLAKRLLAHFSNDQREDEKLDHCSDEERWKSPPQFKVVKLEADGSEQKTAKATCGSRTEAEDKIEELESAEWQKLLEYREGLKKKKPTDEELKVKMPKYTIKTIPSEPRKCPLCECAPWCSQRMAELLANQSVATSEK